ncbi:ornithine racemase Orr [Clostridium grantii]|uniref:Predicted amino acid racemase n=1 Tax=Clostridium grantii DSM 8605 TaxID=1121316 RepID=A0A1M5TQT0_9CLOT|nr:ornithine racemase Orr [Clostridium grantii]SHH53122.1 Predicted amino acid racemase [Clostridium grantii DSM 8605]
MYPRILIDLKKFSNNVKIVKEKADKKGIEIFGVSKVFCGDEVIAKEYAALGLSAIADSRIENLKKLKDVDIKKVLLRLPMQSEIEDVVKYADISLNSEISTLELISQEAEKQGKIHNVILMVDMGDLREGFYDEEEVYFAVGKLLFLKGIKIIGIGTNLSCFGAIIPKISHMHKLKEIKNNIEIRYNIKLQYVSGGNSSSYYLMDNEELPTEINNLRIGEIFVCGNETAFGNKVTGTFDDVFVLEAEIIELKNKPSLPIGESGVDAFGKKPVYMDKGNMLRAICAVGKQDVSLDALVPFDKDIEVLGGSSDHMIIDVSKSKNKYNVGKTIKFKLKYGGILSVMTSDYAEKVYIR